jgi:hypothetical protein
VDETSSVWGDPVEVLDIEGSKVSDIPDRFLTDRGLRLVKAVERKIL